MAMSEKRRVYLKEYREKTIRRIPLDVSPKMYNQIKAAADADGRSVNEWIRLAVAVQLVRKK